MAADAPSLPLPPRLPAPIRSSTGWSRPVHADHAEVAAAEAAERQAARARRLPGRPLEPRCVGRSADGVEVLEDGAVLHLAALCLADAELRLAGVDDPAFVALKAQYADVLGGAPPGMPPDRGMELELETGGAPSPRSRPVKRLSEGELAELLQFPLRAQLVDLLDRGWIQHSTAGHAAAAVFARKPGGPWRICCDYRGLNAVTRPAVEPLPHMDALLDGTRGSRFFATLDLASSWASSGVECGAFRPARGLVAAHAGHESGSDRRPRLSRGSGCDADTLAASAGLGAHPWRGPWGVGPAGPVRAGVPGRRFGALANAGAAPA